MRNITSKQYANFYFARKFIMKTKNINREIEIAKSSNYHNEIGDPLMSSLDYSYDNYANQTCMTHPYV